MADPKERAHQLIDRMAPGQVEVVINLLEIILDPTARSMAQAPFEDEAISEEENSAAEASKTWLKSNSPISNDNVLAEFGLHPDDFERMSRTPSDPQKPSK
jgi:hypothetical protein